MEILLEVYGDTQVRRDLLRFEAAASDMKPVFEALADDFLEIETEQFDSEGGRSGNPWAPLTDSTRAAKERMNHDPRILHATLAMRHSLTAKEDSAHVREITDDGLHVGTRVASPAGFPYAAAHQNPLQGQTQRRPVDFTEDDKQRWVKEMQAALVYAP